MNNYTYQVTARCFLLLCQKQRLLSTGKAGKTLKNREKIQCCQGRIFDTEKRKDDQKTERKTK